MRWSRVVALAALAIAAVACGGPPPGPSATGGPAFRVVETSGALGEITDMALDYSSRPRPSGYFIPDLETRGIRLRRAGLADPIVLVRWADVKAVDIAGTSAVAVLNTGSIVSGELIPFELTGKREQKDYRVDSSLVRQIQPASASGAVTK